MANRNMAPSLKYGLVGAGLTAGLLALAISQENGPTPLATTIEHSVNDAMLSGKKLDTQNWLTHPTRVTSQETLDVVNFDVRTVLGEKPDKPSARIRAIGFCATAELSGLKASDEASAAFTSAVRDHDGNQPSADSLYDKAGKQCEQSLITAINAGDINVVIYPLGTS